MSYEFASADADAFSLHDCSATSIMRDEGKLTFLFPDGIAYEGYGREWPNTGKAAVSFGTECAELTMFEPVDGQSIRKRFKADELIEKVNAGEWELEFADRYVGYQRMLYICWVWRNEAPRFCDAQLFFDTDDETYFWDAPKKAD